MKRVILLLYGAACYFVFLVTLLYGVAFIGNFGLANTMDSDPRSSVAMALMVNLGLLTLFAAQHSIMARQWFKAAWTVIVPQPAERATYVLFSSIALLALFRYWQPMGGVIWEFTNPAAVTAAYGVYGIGLLLVLISTFLIDHFDLFGLRQVWLNFTGRRYTEHAFRTPGLYSIIRHPIYLGWTISFWATPKMTTAHLVFAVVTTAYMLIAIRWEESDLIEAHGSSYREYRKKVPMMLPIRLSSKTSVPTEELPAFRRP